MWLFYKKCKTITNDEFVLNIVKGYKIPFCKPIDQNENISRSNSLEELCELNKSIKKLEIFGAIEKFNQKKVNFFLHNYCDKKQMKLMDPCLT